MDDQQHHQNNDDVPTDPREMRHLILSLRQQLKDKELELSEFQEASQQLEEELEADLKQKEKTIASLKREVELVQSQSARKTTEVKELSLKNVEQQENLSQLRSECSRLGDYVRELEQFNDDLERRTRHLEASLADVEAKLHAQIERNVLLENELDDKEQLEVAIQRLKDETRDLKGEIAVQSAVSQQSIHNRRNSSITSSSQKSSESQVTTGAASETPTSPQRTSQPTTPVSHHPHHPQVNGHHFNSNSHPIPSPRNSISSSAVAAVANQNQNGAPLQNGFSNANGYTNMGNTTPIKSSALHHHHHHLCGSHSLSQSTRLSALNIVSDLLRKVGALESKLSAAATCSSSIASSSSNPAAASAVAAKSSVASILSTTSNHNSSSSPTKPVVSTPID